MYASVDLTPVFARYRCENDGLVSFVWLPSALRINLSSKKLSYSFLEMRFGYPEHDKDKIVSFKFSEDSLPFTEKKIRKGWNSYFIKLPVEVRERGEIIIEFSKSLDVDGDNRFLGAMLSYCLLFNSHPYREQIEALNTLIDECIETSQRNQKSFDIRKYLTEKITSDESAFYATHVLPPITSEEIHAGMGRYSVLGKREVWLEKYIDPDSCVLDIGCGFGGLGFLAPKGVQLYGVDLSEENINRAKASGYQEVFQTSASSLPFPDNYFDYIVSLDVFGHIAVHEKDAVMSELYRVLKVGGSMMHGIEVDAFDPNKMDVADFSRMVLVDGHIGIETRDKVLERFRKYYVVEEEFLVGNGCMSADHWIRAHYLYGTNLSAELIHYLLNLSTLEKQAFDIGTGTTFWALYAENYDSKGSGGLYFIRARKPRSLS